MTRAPETSLYQPVKSFLEAQGFEVKGEIGGCDLLAVRADENPRVVIAELKTALNLELILQGVDRMRVADEVWLAAGLTRRGRDQDRRVRRLCRLIGFGLLTVHPATGRVEVVIEPAPYAPRPDAPRRRRLLREHAARHGDPAIGGSTRQKLMTAYRQRALACAAVLRSGPKRPRDLKPYAEDAASILARDVYGWFARIERGVYGLAEAGEAALLRWPTQIADTPPPPFDWHAGKITRDTVIFETYGNTANARRFFRTVCGAKFRFDRSFMAWIKDGTPKTMGDAADEWRRRAMVRGART